MRFKADWLHQMVALGFALCTAGPVNASPGNHIVSLDLCSDWLLIHHAKASQSITLSPLLNQYPFPSDTQQRDTHDGSLEQILALKPDVVVVGEFNAFMLRKRLQSLGVNVVTTPIPQTVKALDDLSSKIESLLDEAQQPKAKRASAVFHGSVSASSNRSHGRLLLLGANGYGTGRNTLEDSLITRAGWVNYIQTDGHVRLDLEALAMDPPDAIVWSAPASPALAYQFAQHPVLKRAVPPQKWIQTDAWRWQCPGPWMQELVQQLQP